jgi:hypothetical protein
MKLYRSMLATVMCLGFVPIAFADVDDWPKTNIQTIDIGKLDAIDEVVYGQSAKDDRMLLLPETCFFHGERMTLSGDVPPRSAQAALNGGKGFAQIDGPDSASQEVVWPIWLHATGRAKLTVSFAAGQKPATLLVKLGEEVKTLRSPGGNASVEFDKAITGQQTLIISRPNDAAESPVAITQVEIAGPAIHDALLLRARWRPGAIHCGFSSSALAASGNKSRMWVMEVRPEHIEAGFYAPITTPFGYFGSTFEPDGTSGGVNFSMWSFGRGKAEPPMAQLSHLLGVGSPQANFGGFNGEGTGVKLRGWNPYEGRHLTSVVLALRVETGDEYDTFTGYFYDTQAHAWRFYACGRKWAGGRRQKKADDLLPGSFVEVPGPPNVQRTGQTIRSGDFRGRCCDTAGNWYPIDKMEGGGGDVKDEATNRAWTTTPDGWFKMSMGGMIHYRYPARVATTLPTTKPAQPEYMDPKRLKALESLPTTITVTSAKVVDGKLELEIDLQSDSKNPSKLKVLYGATDALSFEQRWAHAQDVGSFAVGKSQITIPDAPAKGICRVMATNETGIYVSANAAVWP